MAARLGKLAPVAIVAAMAAWCSWPYLGEMPGQGVPPLPEDAPKISAALLNPKFEPGCGRNPFQLAAGAERVAAEPVKTPAVGRTPNAKTPGVSKERPVGKTPAEQLAGLTLLGTYVGPTRRVAIINGASWEPGDRLPLDGTETARIAAITDSGVSLDIQGQSVALSYRNPAPGADRRGPASTKSPLAESIGPTGVRFRLPAPSSARPPASATSAARAPKSASDKGASPSNRSGR